MNAHTRTPDKQQFHPVLVEIDTNVRDWLAKNTLRNCTPHRYGNKNQRCHNSTVRINTSSFLRVRLSSGKHDNSNTHVALWTSGFCGFPVSSEHMSCAHRQNHLQSISMCLKCVSSERDLFSFTDEKTVPPGILLIDSQLPTVHSAVAPQYTR